MPSKRIDKRIAKANLAHKDAVAVDRAARGAKSSQLLESLLAGSHDKRINALAPGSKIASRLVDKDRLTLLNSMRKLEISTQIIAADFATPYELLRSRLRFRMWPVILCGIFIGGGIGIAAFAYIRTPEAMVVVVGTSSWDVESIHPDGAKTTDIIKPSDKTVYGLVRIHGDYGVLRRWLPGRGYAQFKLPLSSLQYAK